MREAKIALSKFELELVSDPGWILTKNAVMRKGVLLLSLLQDRLKDYLQDRAFFPAETLIISPKISKGENYQGLPYMILDYPRFFSAEHTLACRFMFWWGHSFSLTFHLKGIYLKKYEQKIIRHFSYFASERFFICVNEYEWDHHFGETNYVPVSRFNPRTWEAIVSGKPFFKIATRYPLAQWDTIPEQMADCFIKTTELLND
jgi:hypothetical protein